MRRLYYLLAGVMLSVMVLAACNSADRKNVANTGGVRNGPVTTTTTTTTTITPNVPSDNVRRVTTVELRDALDKGTAIVVDTRDANSYHTSHIKGSINIPLNDVANRLQELPRDKMIVAYCS